MFYGGFSIDRLSELVPLDGDPLAKRGGVTGRIILACLRQQLPAVLEEGMTLQHDNGPTYRARIVQNWLRIYCRLEGIFMVDWPACSPDLNPIENLWKLLKERICKRYPELALMPVTGEAIAALIEAAQEVWNHLEPEVLENLINSMPKRLAALHQAQGYYTKY
jgi:transposase